MEAAQRDLHQLAGIDPKNVVDEYQARDLAALSDASLYREIGDDRLAAARARHDQLHAACAAGSDGAAMAWCAWPIRRSAELARLQMVVSAGGVWSRRASAGAGGGDEAVPRFNNRFGRVCPHLQAG